MLAIRGGVLQGSAISADEVESLATLPPLDVLRGQVLGAIVAPLKAFAGLVTAPLRNLVGLIDARIEQLGGAARAPAGSSPGRPARRACRGGSTDSEPKRAATEEQEE